MRLRSPPSRRRAASLAEAAITYPVVLLLTLGVFIVSLGVFRYLEVAALAREGARWASVHGSQYQQDTGNSMATPSSVYTSAIQPKAVGLDLSQLSCSVTWTNGEVTTYNDLSGNVVENKVTVTVTYNWIPEAYLGHVTLSSTSVMAMQY